MIWENGVALAQSQRFPKGERRSVADVDLDLLQAERRRTGTFDDNRRQHTAHTDRFRLVSFRLEPPAGIVDLRRRVERFPFVPSDEASAEILPRTNPSRSPARN